MSYDYPPSPQPQPGGYPAPPPPNHLVMAIVTTVACCLPLGIVSLVYSNKVNTLWQTGRHAEAIEASNKAKTWWIASIVVGVVAIVIYLVVVVGVIGFSGNFSDPY
ncbi:MAG: CD225/dispanin family protein [Sporichthyaceae bacterium]|nr:CD225/dispanin family protein [Sporichthyaceae bacterium]